MNAVRVPWSAASFLAYLGGLTILVAMLVFLSVESGENGASGLVGWSALALAVLTLLALASKRKGRLVTAGLYALSVVAAFVVFFGALLDWFGWLPDTNVTFKGFHFWLLVLELAAVVAAVVALHVFRFPLLVLLVAVTAWFFVTDLLSGGGDWSATVTIAYGLALLGVAVSYDSSGARIYGFWLHVVSGLTIGGGLLWFFHDGDWEWGVIGVAAVLYIGLGDRLLRSSWIVLAAWALLQVTTHFAERFANVRLFAFFPLGFFFFPFFGFGDSDQNQQHRWAAPLSYAALGLVFIMLAQLIARRRREAIPGADVL
jgi:MFS family permease